MRVSGACNRSNSRQNNKHAKKGKNGGRVEVSVSERKHLTLGNKPSLSKRHTYRVLDSFTTSQSNSRRPAQLLTQTSAAKALGRCCCRRWAPCTWSLQ